MADRYSYQLSAESRERLIGLAKKAKEKVKEKETAQEDVEDTGRNEVENKNDATNASIHSEQMGKPSHDRLSRVSSPYSKPGSRSSSAPKSEQDLYEEKSDISNTKSTASRHHEKSKGKTKHKRKKRPKTIIEEEDDPEQGVEFFRCHSAGWEQWTTSMLICFVLFGNSLTSMTFNDDDASCISLFYEYSGSEVANYLNSTHAYMYPLGTMLSLYLSFWDVLRGARHCLLVGGTVTLTGILFRIVSVAFGGQDWGYLAILLGQVFCGLGQPLILNMLLKVVDSWFPVRVRDWVTLELYMAHPVGMVCGVLLSLRLPLMLGCSGQMWLVLYALQGALVLAGILLVFFFFEDIPKDKRGRLVPASLSSKRIIKAQVKYVGQKWRLGSIVQKQAWFTLRSMNFVFLMIAFAMLVAHVFGTIASPATSNIIANPLYSEHQGSVWALIYSVVYVFGGVCGVFAYGSILSFNKNPVYHTARKIGFFVLAGFSFFCNWFEDEDCLKCTGVCHFFTGMISLPLVPLTLQSGVELLYDIPHETSTGLLFSLGSIFFVFFNYSSHAGEDVASMETIVSKQNAVVFGIIAAIFSFLSKGDYRRHEMPKESSYLKQIFQVQQPQE